MLGELVAAMTSEHQNRRTRRNATISIAAAGITLMTAGACRPTTKPLPEPSYTYQQAIEMTRQRIDGIIGQIEPRPRFEVISSDGKVPCSGPNDDEDTGQIMYERSGWILGVPHANNDTVLATVKNYWRSNGYTISVDESTRSPRNWHVIARDPAGFKTSLVESNLGNLSLLVQSPCVYPQAEPASPSR